MMDTYKSMTELVRNEKDWMIETQDRNSKSLITAIHGGGIECGTSELALLVAELSNANYFTFKGLKPNNKNACGMGVQIEISTQQRKEFFSRNDFSQKNRENTHNWTEDMYYYANAICAAINDRKWVET